MKHVSFVLVSLALFIFICGVFLPPEIQGAGGSDKKGKYYFKKSCKTCHGKDGDGGELTPMSKTQAQWETFFTAGKHGEQDMTDVMEEEKLIHVQTFLINHAADSSQPETCG